MIFRKREHGLWSSIVSDVIIGWVFVKSDSTFVIFFVIFILILYVNYDMQGCCLKKDRVCTRQAANGSKRYRS